MFSKKKRRLAVPCPGVCIGFAFAQPELDERIRFRSADAGPDENVVEFEGHNNDPLVSLRS